MPKVEAFSGRQLTLCPDHICTENRQHGTQHKPSAQSGHPGEPNSDSAAQATTVHIIIVCRRQLSFTFSVIPAPVALSSRFDREDKPHHLEGGRTTLRSQ